MRRGVEVEMIDDDAAIDAALDAWFDGWVDWRKEVAGQYRPDMRRAIAAYQAASEARAEKKGKLK
jgi:hypothetical protein